MIKVQCDKGAMTGTPREVMYTGVWLSRDLWHHRCRLQCYSERVVGNLLQDSYFNYNWSGGGGRVVG